jgi:hypothetical protein
MPQIQEITPEQTEILRNVATAIESCIPDSCHFICVVLIPGGDTGMQVRMATSLQDPRRVGLVLSEVATTTLAPGREFIKAETKIKQ